MANPDTDGLTYFGCSIIQNTSISNYKKQLETSIDILGTKDIDGNMITPAPTLKFLRKALPVFAHSFWNSLNSWTPDDHSWKNSSGGTIDYYFNLCTNLSLDEIKDSASIQKDTITYAYDMNQVGDNFTYITAKNALLNTNIKISNFNFKVKSWNHTGRGSFMGGLVVAWGYHLNSPIGIVNIFEFRISDNDETFEYNGDINYTITEEIPIGAKVWIYFKLFSMTNKNPIVGHAHFGVDFTISQYSIDIKTTQAALDTVINGVRYIDVLKQCSKFIGKLHVDAEIFDVGGQHYGNICYNRSLLSVSTANSLKLVSETSPEGEFLGEVISNTDATFMALGFYFWNGMCWIILDDHITKLSLTNNTTPAGINTGDLIYNTNQSVNPNSLAYWSGSAWVGLEYTRPFITSFKDAYETVMTIETCSDYEIQSDKIYIGQYSDFYKDIEIASFPIIASKDYKVNWNDRFKLNNIKLGFETFETNRLSKNTANDIHTEAEWSIPNKHVENKFERSIKYIRSGYSAQAMVDLETKTPATADENDDKVYIADITELLSNTVCEFTANLQLTLANGKLEISNLSNNSSGQDIVINWNMRGLKLGDNFQIKDGQNSGNYTVSAITATTLSLTPIVGFTPTYSGIATITVYYIYTDIYWQTKTNEGYDQVNNLASPTLYPNLDYSLRRILRNWETYLSSAIFYKKDKIIQKLFFKNNPPLSTKKVGENLIIELENIPCLSLPNPLLTPKIINADVTASFEDILNLLDTYKNTRGYVTCYDEVGDEIKGYPQEIDYAWKSGRLKLKLEEKYSLNPNQKFDKTFDKTFQ